MTSIKKIASAALTLLVLAALTVGCAGHRVWFPRTPALEQRLANLAQHNADLSGSVDIYWSAEQIPFIVAQSDADLAYSLGMVHAHLRATQIALYRHIAYGRLSEIAGPVATDIDHSLRLLDFGRAVPSNIAALPDDTRQWLQRFIDGLNHQLSNGPLPPEAGLLKLDLKPFTLSDLLTIGRFLSTDVGWATLYLLAEHRVKFSQNGQFPNDWQRLAESFNTGAAGNDASAADRSVNAFFAQWNRSGSNSIAVSGNRTASGAPLLANDPHLGLNLPNFWLLAGMKSPSFHQVGMMLPGLPFVALGRNPDIAWGGTNLRAATSDLVQLSQQHVRKKPSKIARRWWFDKSISLADSDYGPVISSSPYWPALPSDQPVALRWAGHYPSDEFTAFLRANRADSVQAFRSAFAGYGVSAQNYVVADRHGNIGQLLAAKMPVRDSQFPKQLLRTPQQSDANWQHLQGPLELPYQLNPASGVIVSANNRPRFGQQTIGYFFPADDRVERLTELATQKDITVETAKKWQQDVFSQPALELARILYKASRPAQDADSEQLTSLLKTWDGHYAADAPDPVAFECLLTSTVMRLYKDKNHNEVPTIRQQWPYLQRYLANDLTALDEQQRLELFNAALPEAVDCSRSYSSWGAMHRLKVRHILGNAPVVGGLFVLHDWPAAGSRNTVYKRAHGLENKRHSTFYGAQARHISDLSDPDANWFILLGGNDGWWKSENFADQARRFQQGEYLRLPLSLEQVKQWPHRTTLKPNTN